jgi:hypothetical protein
MLDRVRFVAGVLLIRGGHRLDITSVEWIDYDEEVPMGKLIRLDRSGHTTLAGWTAAGDGLAEAARH